jgi:hypothetical protein
LPPDLHGLTAGAVLEGAASRANSGNRRLCDPRGLAKPLVIIWRSIPVAPLYRLRSPQEFNKLLEIIPEP